MAESTAARVSAIAETWAARRTETARTLTANGLRGFVELMNAQTRLLIRELNIQDPTLWEGLAELCNNAATLTSGAKIHAEHIDRTSL